MCSVYSQITDGSVSKHFCNVKLYKGSTTLHFIFRFRDGVALAESPRLKLLPVDSQTQILILTQVEESDIGVYECRAESKAGATSSKAKLNITGNLKLCAKLSVWQV